MYKIKLNVICSFGISTEASAPEVLSLVHVLFMAHDKITHYKSTVLFVPHTCNTCNNYTYRKLFSELSVNPDLLGRLQRLGIERAFEVQDKTLPLTLEGRCV